MKHPHVRGQLLRFGPSSMALIVCNLIPLVLAVVLGWDVLNVLMLFWVENLIVGALNIARMLTCKPLDPVTWVGRVIMVPFFTVHYGIFCMVHGAFILGMFGGMDSLEGSMSPASLAATLSVKGLWLGVGCLTASHCISLLVNWLGRGEFNETELDELMARPYGRIIVLHMTIIFGALPVLLTGSHWFAVGLLMLLKTGVDLTAHWHERHELEQGTTS